MNIHQTIRLQAENEKLREEIEFRDKQFNLLNEKYFSIQKVVKGLILENQELIKKARVL